MDSFEKDLEKAVKEHNNALEKGEINKSSQNSKFAGFFFERSQNSLLTANILYQISTSLKDKSELKVADSYESFMWVIVTCYYSMFYMASALIAKRGIKVGSLDAHKHVKNAFLRLYIENSFLERRFGIEYNECKEMAQDLMQERSKRSRYQYDIGVSALKRDAEISINRAKNFFEKTRTIIEG